MSWVTLSHSFQVVWLHKVFIRINSFCNRQSSFKRSSRNYRMMISHLKAYRTRRIRFLHSVIPNKISQCTQLSVRTQYLKTLVPKHLEQTRRLIRLFEVVILPPVLNSMVSRNLVIQHNSNKLRIILKRYRILKFKIGP